MILQKEPSSRIFQYFYSRKVIAYRVRSRVHSTNPTGPYAEKLCGSYPMNQRTPRKKQVELFKQNGLEALHTFSRCSHPYLAIRTRDLREDAHNRSNKMKEPHGEHKKRDNRLSLRQ